MAILGVVVVVLGLVGACEPGWRAPVATRAPSFVSSPVPSPTVTPLTATQTPAAGSTIAFLEASDGHQNIFLIRPDGSQQTQLTRHDYIPGGDFAWSPDGANLLFDSGGPEVEGKTRLENGLNIYVADVQSGVETQLTNSGKDIHPAWSPDGRMIAFASARDGCYGIYLMNADGTDQRRLTADTTDRSEAFPSWSPDGDQIVFSARDCSGAEAIYIVNRDGSGERILTAQVPSAYGPEWSPDGRYIAFTAYPRFVDGDTGGESRVGLVRPDGTGLKLLNTGSSFDQNPKWSPDGRRLAFVAYGSGSVFQTTLEEGRLIVVDIDSEQHRVLARPVHSWGLTWAPGGDKIAYRPAAASQAAVRKDGSIWVVNVDGSGDYMLVDSGSSPVWSPYQKLGDR